MAIAFSSLSLTLGTVRTEPERELIDPLSPARISRAAQVIGSPAFIFAGWIFALETQTKWWKPNLMSIGWWMCVHRPLSRAHDTKSVLILAERFGAQWDVELHRRLGVRVLRHLWVSSPSPFLSTNQQNRRTEHPLSCRNASIWRQVSPSCPSVLAITLPKRFTPHIRQGVHRIDLARFSRRRAHRPTSTTRKSSSTGGRRSRRSGARGPS